MQQMQPDPMAMMQQMKPMQPMQQMQPPTYPMPQQAIDPAQQSAATTMPTQTVPSAPVAQDLLYQLPVRRRRRRLPIRVPRPAASESSASAVSDYGYYGGYRGYGW